MWRPACELAARGVAVYVAACVLSAQLVHAQGKLPIKVPKAQQIIKRATKTAGRSLGLSGGKLWLFSIAVILAIALGFFLWTRRKKRKAEPAVSADAQGGAIPTAEPLSPGQLRKVWNRFMAGLPPVFRRSIGNFQTFMVLGAAGSGKSSVIATYTDWERQAKQFLASQTTDPDLQVYLGSNAVILELPARILHDTSPIARRAIMGLLKPILRRRSPVIVVPVDLGALSRMAPEGVRALADTVRGKINAIASARGKTAMTGPVEVRVVLTHLDAIEGYPIFTEFAERQDVPLRFFIEPADDARSMREQVAEGVAGFGTYLPLALTKLPSAKYKQVVSFLKDAPQHFGTLDVFLEALFASESLNPRPAAGPIYFSTDSAVGAVSNPFHVTSDELHAGAMRPVRTHLVSASVLGAACAAYLLTAFALERPLWKEAVGQIRGHESVAFDSSTRDAIRAFSRRGDALLRFFPSFYAAAQVDIDDRLSRNLRDHVLIPSLKASMHEELWPHRKALYRLAVIHASRGTELGRIAHGLDAGPLGEEFEPGVIRDYVNATAEPYGEKLRLDALHQRDEVKLAFSPEPWVNFLRRIEATIERDYIDHAELHELKEQARAHLAGIETIRTYGYSDRILRQLSQYKPDFERHLADISSPQVSDQLLAPMASFLEHIVQTEDLGQPARMHLPRFSDQLRTLLGEQGISRTFTIQVPRRAPGGGLSDTDIVSFRFERAQWSALIRASRIRDLVRSFVTRRHEREGETFFPDDVSLRSYALNPSVRGPSGNAIFTGTALLDGRYTRMAYDIHVRPALEDFLLVLDPLSAALPPAELENLKDHIRREVDQYAQRYRFQVDQFYKAYGVKARVPDALAVAYSQLSRPTSPLTYFLEVVHANTKLDYATQDEDLEALLQPLQYALARYDSIDAVMAAEPGGARELDNYLGIVEQVRVRLMTAVERPSPEPGTVGLAGNLVDQLYPPGQMALETITDQEDVDDLVRGWLTKMQLQGALARPFQLPVQQLLAVGKGELERVVEEVWHYEVLRNLDPLMRKFPFDREADVEITPEELELAFHPKRGLVFDRYRRFFEPVTRTDGGGYRPRRRDISLPPQMFPLLNRIGVLTNALWDEKGGPRPLTMNVRSIPFDATRDMRSVLTLVYVKFGTASVFNFNQQPATKKLEMDWTVPQTSQVGVQLTNARSGRQRYPKSLVTRESYFSHLHLLLRANAPVPGRAVQNFRGLDGEIMREMQWHVPYGDDERRTATVRFLVGGDPLSFFDFGELTRRGEKRFAALTMGAH